MSARGYERWCLLSIALVLSGCMPSCSCGTPSSDTSGTPGATPAVAVGAAGGSASPGPGPTPAPTNLAASSAGAGEEPPPTAAAEVPSSGAAEAGAAVPALPGAPPVVVAPPKPPPTTLREAFPDVAKGPTTASLAKTKQALGKAAVASKAPLRTPTQLSAVMPAKVANLAPRSAATSGPTRAGDLPIAVAAQQYGSAGRQVYVKVSDTAQAPFMRDPVLKRLDKQGTAADGFLHGRFIGAYPAIAQYYPQHRSSQLIVLVDNRYVVEVRVTGATSAYEAQDVFKSLSLSTLTGGKP